MAPQTYSTRQSQHHQAAQQERSVILLEAEPEGWQETQRPGLLHHKQQAQAEQYLASEAQYDLVLKKKPYLLNFQLPGFQLPDQGQRSQT
jgi:hypothetical protein